MKVLMISGDRNMLIPGGEASRRLELQRSQVEELKLYVWPYQGFLAPLVEKEKFDVVTAQDPFWRGAIAWFLARRTGARLNLQIHTDLSEQSLFRRIVAKFLLRRADSVRVVSEKIKNYLAPLRLKVVHVLPIYIDIERFKGLKHHPHPHFKKTILWIGRFEPEKDPLFALSILRQVQAAGIDARLVMLGKGNLEQQLHTQADALPVEFPGWQDPRLYLQMADVLLCTSNHESWGASIVEALAAGCPVVAPDVGVAREAGAIISARSNLAEAVVETIRSGRRGELKLNLLDKEEWGKQWKNTL